MQVRSQTSNKLVLHSQKTPRFVRVMAFFLVGFLGISILVQVGIVLPILLKISKLEVLTCDRQTQVQAQAQIQVDSNANNTDNNSNQITCRLVDHGLFAQNKQETILDNFSITGARVEQRRPSESSIRYQVILQTQSGDLPILNSDPASAERINTFVDDTTQTSLIVEQDYRWIAPAFLAAAIIPAIAIVLGLGYFQTLQATYTFDRISNKLTVTKKSYLRTGTREYQNLRDITDVQYEEFKGQKGSIFYRIRLDLSSGKKLRLPVLAYYNPRLRVKEYEDLTPEKFQQDTQTAVDIIRDFLDL